MPKFEYWDGASWYSVATETFVNSKVFDINSNTSGQLNINRLSGYPSSTNAFLRGDGTWILPYINNLNINSDVSFANYKIINLANPINSQDAVTKNYVDTKDVNSFPITAAGFGLGGYNIYNLGNPTQPQHAATKAYVDSVIPSGSINLSGAISGSGTLGSSIVTTFSDTINKSSDQTFNFSSSTSNFNFYFPNSGGNGTKIRMGRSGGTTGLYGFEFQSTTLGNGTPIFNFNFSGTNSIYNIFTLTENTPQIIFNSYRLSGILEPQISTDAATKNYADTSTIASSRISGYPSNSNLFLNGLGSWSTPTAAVSLPLNLYTSSLNDGITIYNSNNSATATGFFAYNQNINNGAQFGFNSSTSEGYVWTGSGLSLKFGTNNTLRIKINSSGSIDCQSNDILTTGTINAQTGTLKGNNLSTYNAGSISILSSLAMNNNYINFLPTPINNQDAATKQFVLDNTGAVGQSILHGFNNATYSTNVSVGDHIKFDGVAFVRGSNISLDTSSSYTTSTGVASVGRITLAAGKTYKLTGSINNVVSANYNAMRWYNSDTNTALGVVSGMSSPVSTTDRVPSAGFIAYITTSVSTRVELRIIWNALSSVNGTGDGVGPTWFAVEEV